MHAWPLFQHHWPHTCKNLTISKQESIDRFRSQKSSGLVHLCLGTFQWQIICMYKLTLTPLVMATQLRLTHTAAIWQCKEWEMEQTWVLSDPCPSLPAPPWHNTPGPMYQCKHQDHLCPTTCTGNHLFSSLESPWTCFTNMFFSTSKHRKCEHWRGDGHQLTDVNPMRRSDKYQTKACSFRP